MSFTKGRNHSSPAGILLFRLTIIDIPLANLMEISESGTLIFYPRLLVIIRLSRLASEIFACDTWTDGQTDGRTDNADYYYSGSANKIEVVRHVCGADIRPTEGAASSIITRYYTTTMRPRCNVSTRLTADRAANDTHRYVGNDRHKLELLRLMELKKRY